MFESRFWGLECSQTNIPKHLREKLAIFFKNSHAKMKMHHFPRAEQETKNFEFDFYLELLLSLFPSLFHSSLWEDRLNPSLSSTSYIKINLLRVLYIAVQIRS